MPPLYDNDNGINGINDFNDADLAQTIEQVRDRLESGDDAHQLLMQLLDWLSEQSRVWQEAMGTMQERQNGFEKALILLCGHQQQTARRTSAMAKSLQAALTSRPLAKSRLTPSNAKAALHAASDGKESLIDVAKKGLFAKAVVQLFGPRGGSVVPYDRVKAAKLLQAGTLTNYQHMVWKKTGRLHDDVAS
jgi:hypothetical protein